MIGDWRLVIDDWWLMIHDWWLIVDDCWWLMVDDCWLMIGWHIYLYIYLYIWILVESCQNYSQIIATCWKKRFQKIETMRHVAFLISILNGIRTVRIRRVKVQISDRQNIAVERKRIPKRKKMRRVALIIFHIEWCPYGAYS